MNVPLWQQGHKYVGYYREEVWKIKEFSANQMKASILIPAFNAAAFLEETLKSCILQGTETVLEIVVVDDHSEDTTLDVATSFAKAHPQFNFVIERNPGKGACAARNRAFALASGEAIQWLDADDILGEGKLQSSSIF